MIQMKQNFIITQSVLDLKCVKRIIWLQQAKFFCLPALKSGSAGENNQVKYRSIAAMQWCAN
jgi:hypothetical protein